MSMSSLTLLRYVEDMQISNDDFSLLLKTISVILNDQARQIDLL